MSVRRAPLAVLLAALAVLGAAAGAGAQPDLSTTAVVGDSFASGEGSGPPFDAGTNVPRDRCHRGPLAWPRLLGVPAGRQLACSGTTLAGLTSAQASIAPDDVPQLTRLAALPGTTQVLVMVGGNDAGFAPVLTRCVVGSCVAAARARVATLPAIGVRLEAAYRAIAAAAPGARVVAVDYPFIVPAARPRGARCPWLAPAEIRATRALVGALDATIAAAAQGAGVEHAAVGDPLRGHELCTASPWVYPVVFSLTNTQQGHPRPAGQAAIAARVRAWLDAHPGTPAS